MADETKAGTGDGESIPAMLAAPSPKKAALLKAAPKAVKSAAKPSAPATAVALPTVPVAAVVAQKPVAVAKAVEPAKAPVPIAEVEPLPAPIAAPEPVLAMKPEPAPTPEPVPTPEPAAVAPASITPAVAPAPVATTPPAAVPADIQKESQMATTIENATQTTTDKAQAMFAETSERAKSAMAKSTAMVEEMGAFGKGNVEALVESSKIAAKGIETLGQDAAEFTRKSFEDATAAFKTLASVKSPTEFMKLQSDYMRSAFDAMVAETSRSTETMLKLAGEVAQPISNRMAVAADKMKVAA